MDLELIGESILGDGFFWFEQAVDVQLVLIRLCSTSYPVHDS